MRQHKSKRARCRRCAKCCGYVCIQIDAPRRRADFEEFAWLLAHRGVSIRVEKRSWFVLVETPCRFLNRQNHCNMYEGRPATCQRYSPEHCDFGNTPGEKDTDADHVFATLDELRAYRDDRFPLKQRKRR